METTTEKGIGSGFVKWFGILLAIIIGVILIVKVIIPLSGLAIALLWSISGFLAFIIRAFVFILLTLGTILGMILLFSWIIREVSH